MNRVVPQQTTLKYGSETENCQNNWIQHKQRSPASTYTRKSIFVVNALFSETFKPNCFRIVEN